MDMLTGDQIAEANLTDCRCAAGVQPRCRDGLDKGMA